MFLLSGIVFLIGCLTILLLGVCYYFVKEIQLQTKQMQTVYKEKSTILMLNNNISNHQQQRCQCHNQKNIAKLSPKIKGLKKENEKYHNKGQVLYHDTLPLAITSDQVPQQSTRRAYSTLNLSSSLSTLPTSIGYSSKRIEHNLSMVIKQNSTDI